MHQVLYMYIVQLPNEEGDMPISMQNCKCIVAVVFHFNQLLHCNVWVYL